MDTVGQEGECRPGSAPEVVLLAEGSWSLRQLLAQRFREAGSAVVEAADGVEAVYALAQALPDGIVAAKGLQRLDGLSLARNLCQVIKTAQIPCVLLVDDPTEAQTIQEAGIPRRVSCAVRPGSIEDLFQVTLGELSQLARVPCDHSAAPTGTSTDRGGFTDETDGLHRVLGYLEEVLRLVRGNQFPGPVVPSLFQEITWLTVEEEVELQQLTRIAERHPPIFLRLLALTNSALYARAGSPVRRVEDAISWLGSRRTLTVMQAIAMTGYVVATEDALQHLILKSLQRSYVVAHTAEYLASLSRGVSGRDVFGLGLLHNVGATFLLYAVSLLKKDGRITHVDPAALQTVAASRGAYLNETVAASMGLPPDATSLFFVPTTWPRQAQHYPPAIVLVLQAIWIMEQILDHGTECLKPCAGSAALGLTDEVLAAVNEKVPDFRQLAQIYLT